jgi:hypothetical protein
MLRTGSGSWDGDGGGQWWHAFTLVAQRRIESTLRPRRRLGCVGRWFSGRWHTDAAEQYIARVKDYLARRVWETPDFQEL